MAANNYFGFTHGGTQYPGAQATAYPTAQPAYVQPAHQTAYATAAPRAPTSYDTYQSSTNAANQYAYATRTQTAVVPVVAAAPAAPAASYSVAEPAYQAAAKAPPVYTANYQATAQPRAAVLPTKSSTSATYYAGASTPINATPTYTATTSSSTYSGYDAALYSAATTYYHQQNTAKTVGGAPAYKKGIPSYKKPKQPPKQPQLHYCDVCKISCAGPQTYREHLEGQKHKKKEAAAKSGTTSHVRVRGQNQLRCELCDVSCTGSDAYAAHIRGAKHQKVLKLHTKLGKPIPPTDPKVVSNNSAVKAAPTSQTVPKPAVGPTVTKTVPVAPTLKKVVTPAAPKISFVGGTTLKSSGAKMEEVKVTPPSVPASPALTSIKVIDEDEDTLAKLAEKDVQPVGHEYIEEVKNEQGKTVSFNCKLCECKFNDPNAKEMHMKGRRHRLQYKKKVDPSLEVEVKLSYHARKLQEKKLRQASVSPGMGFWDEEMGYHGFGYGRGMGPRFMGPPGAFGNPIRKPDTSDDRHVMAKHASIYPNEQELQAVQNIVSSCEKALKQVSDHIAEIDAPPALKIKVEPEVKVKQEEEENKETVKEEDKDEEEVPPAPRALKGVMRVGVLAKGLLLHGDLNVHLVVLCSEKPTRTMLERVADNLPKQLAGCEEKYDVRICVEEAAVIVTMDTDPKTMCTITMTSPIMRDENLAEGENVTSKPDPPDVLDRQKCLDALAALRHAKWFQARANGLQSCVVVIRILRDLCQRVGTWNPLNQWAMELLVEKCVSSGGPNMSPGDALRRVFECIASGILLPGGPGLLDPCEKEPVDASAALTPQEREDITASAQHALRLIAFRQVHKVLGMEALPPPRFQRQGRFNPRKRRRTEGEEGEGAEAEKKEKTDDGEGSVSLDKNGN